MSGSPRPGEAGEDVALDADNIAVVSLRLLVPWLKQVSSIHREFQVPFQVVSDMGVYRLITANTVGWQSTHETVCRNDLESMRESEYRL
jgi:hypothetical protein